MAHFLPHVDGKSVRVTKSLTLSSGYSVKAYLRQPMGRTLMAPQRSPPQPTPPAAYLTKLRMRERMQYGGPRLREVTRHEHELLASNMRRTYTDGDLRLPRISSRRRQDIELKREVLQSRAREAIRREQRRIERSQSEPRNCRSRVAVGRSRERDAVPLEPAPAFRAMRSREIDAVVRRIASPPARRMAALRYRTSSAASLASSCTGLGPSYSSRSPSARILDERAVQRITKDTIASKLRAAFTYMYRPDPYNVKRGGPTLRELSR